MHTCMQRCARSVCVAAFLRLALSQMLCISRCACGLVWVHRGQHGGSAKTACGSCGEPLYWQSIAKHNHQTQNLVCSPRAKL